MKFYVENKEKAAEWLTVFAAGRQDKFNVVEFAKILSLSLEPLTREQEKIALVESAVGYDRISCSGCNKSFRRRFLMWDNYAPKYCPECGLSVGEVIGDKICPTCGKSKFKSQLGRDGICLSCNAAARKAAATGASARGSRRLAEVTE